ncbi:never in mitosis gene A-related kinase, putative [Ichthyophthirius multifiliis]|uniref:non-specific serine/threonine protein kinase n=1 Tax=Ichthyophthirius multifiliis TaxID=5932 RepID=G0QSF0_ICHMU|nr:never in mitosis gene A-related kinase, putative [Ichthyophthirius multifiliis]EGR31851.1 never in mitosis gene A-related kinase, putative [Ichthyophthirius multifiliis]|eukprot:XP_004035337.1 never in mitosis gene A-related kinase, putative [Ichthyophthirius multifiliis]
MNKDIHEYVGKDMNGYRVQKPIGQGKFSTVYKAETSDNKIAALKKIKIFDMMDPKQRDKCLKEVELMKPLDHKNIIKYLDSFIHNNELIIVTEWAEKGDLKRLIKIQQQEENPFEELKIWEYMNQIASALNHMHEKRIMHRDLKPANIFIASDDILKIGDLGLGREFSSETIEAYSKVGTPLYMSPELLNGEGYDMKSDIWSLGCIIYEFCELKSPFRNENEKMSLMDLFNKITQGQYKKISKRYSEELSNIIDQMIIVDPSKRIDSGYVLFKSQEIIENMKKSPKIDCVLINEDIYEKLTLLEYQKYFCKPINRKPISKIYFALPDNNMILNNEKFFYFAELSYWIMSIKKYDQKNKILAAQQLKDNGIWDSIEECGQQLLQDLRKWGSRLPDQLNISHIRNGYGDTICFILNDILNRELIRVNFKFDQPIFKNEQCDQKVILLDSENEESIKEINSINSSYYEEEKHEEFINKDIEKNENNIIIKSEINEQDWKKEYKRVYQELHDFDKNINKFERQKQEEYYFNLYKMQKYKKSLKNDIFEYKSIHDKFYVQLQNQLDDIKNGQYIINSGNLENIQILQEQARNKNEFLKELKQRSEQVELYVKHLNNLKEQNTRIKKQIQEKEKLITNNNQKQKIQEAIINLNKEIKNMNLKIGIIQASIQQKK